MSIYSYNTSLPIPTPCSARIGVYAYCCCFI
nr:MAG TPA: hypothetical protein [Caudoviricetes sp.]